MESCQDPQNGALIAFFGGYTALTVLKTMHLRGVNTVLIATTAEDEPLPTHTRTLITAYVAEQSGLISAV
jgi:hypothetical protein